MFVYCQLRFTKRCSLKIFVQTLNPSHLLIVVQGVILDDKQGLRVEGIRAFSFS